MRSFSIWIHLQNKIELIRDIFIVGSKCGSKGYCLNVEPDTVSSVCPPPLSQMSDFVFLAICSHCAALPDRRHSGRLGSVNCKGMWHSFLKLRMFLWISEADFCHFHCGVWRKCFRTDTQVNKGVYPKLYSWLTAIDLWTPAKYVFPVETGNTPVHIVILCCFFSPHLTILNIL